MEIKGYQYILQKRRLPDGDWEFVSSNKHDEHVPYPTPFGPKIKQSGEERWDAFFNRKRDVPIQYEYRPMRRPYGEWEPVDEQ